MSITEQEQRTNNLIVNTIDNLVRQSKHPVTAKVLAEVGIASRGELRKLEKVGILKRIQINGGQGIMNAYYTEGVLPDVIQRQRASSSEPVGDTSEVQEHV